MYSSLTPVSTRTTGQFLGIDRHPRYHSFVERPPSVEDLRGRFASAYILTIEINNEERLSLQYKTSSNEGSIDLDEQHYPLWFKLSSKKYLSYIFLFRTLPTLFTLILYSSIKIDDEDEQYELYIPPPFELYQDDDFYLIPYSSSSSLSFVDDKLLHNELERTSITSRTATGQFLCIDHHPCCHSFVNDLYLINTNLLCYHSSSSLIDSSLSTEDLRAHLASVYILITGSSLTEINNENESSF
ncbi:unnamed protein product [Rotaria sordida]|uniref:Uncharacterized protein n=1 Tax=Rotaria sordida TaxID=392033 RepID=A0A819TG10_9BILA|nr:unnamed protein product [Rotaria sordida]